MALDGTSLRQSCEGLVATSDCHDQLQFAMSHSPAGHVVALVVGKKKRQEAVVCSGEAMEEGNLIPSQRGARVRLEYIMSNKWVRA